MEEYAIGEGESVFEAMVEAVADVTGFDPLDLVPMGIEHEDDIFSSCSLRSSRTEVNEITLFWMGCKIEISENTIRVEEL